MGELITKIYEQFHHSEVAEPGPLPAYDPLLPGHYNVTTEAATIAVYVALRAWIQLRKRKQAAVA